MAVPLYTASPINTNAPLSAFPSSPSTFAMRYTPAQALEEVLATTVPLPPSQPVTPSPEAMQNQRANTLAHTSNALPPSPTPLKAQPSHAVTSTTTSHPPTPQRTPSLTRLSIPSTPSPQPQPPSQTLYNNNSDFGSPVSQPSSTYSPPHLPHHHHHPHQHSRNISSISAISGYSSPFLSTPLINNNTHQHQIPSTPGNNPPGYVQNTRDSFEDRPVADVEEQTYTLPRSPLRQAFSPFYAEEPTNTGFGAAQHRHRKSHVSGPGILNGEIFFQPLDGVSDGTQGRDDEGVWEMAGKWARTAYKKLGEAEEGVWRVVSGER